MAKSVLSQLYGDSLLAVYLSRQNGAIYNYPELSWTSDKLKIKASVKAYTVELWDIVHT